MHLYLAFRSQTVYISNKIKHNVYVESIYPLVE